MITTAMPMISARGKLRAGLLTSPATIGIWFQPLYAHKAASMAVPNADIDANEDAGETEVTLLHEAAWLNPKTPTTIARMPRIFNPVSNDWMCPPKLTPRALSPETRRIARMATICWAPNLQARFCPRM